MVFGICTTDCPEDKPRQYCLQVSDGPALKADGPLVLTPLGQSSDAPSCQVVDGPALEGGRSGPTFSDSSDSFQTGIIVVTSTANHLARGHGLSACAPKMCYLHITVRKVCRLINRRGVRV